MVTIWVPSGIDRPYICAVSLDKERKGNEKLCYVRRGSQTKQATRSDYLELMSRSTTTQFDSLVNEQASVSDLSRYDVEEFLKMVESGLDYTRMAEEQLYRSMGLVTGPSECPKVLNIGLMMFSRNPEKFFPYAQIDVVYKPDPTGDGMVEKIFTGPVFKQLIDALYYIKSRYIEEKIFKVSYQAEAIRVYNFPYTAVEETLVNAVYHKDYRIAEQIVVTITKEYLEVLSYPGPDRSIKDDDLKNCHLNSDFNRNKRLGDFLKELNLAEARNTGIPKVLRALRKNTSGMPEYRTNDARTSLRVRIPIHRYFTGERPADEEDSGPVKHRSASEVKSLILDILAREGCITSGQLSQMAGYSKVNNTFRRYVSELIDAGLVGYMYPDNPKHPHQRLCLMMEGELVLDPVDPHTGRPYTE